VGPLRGWGGGGKAFPTSRQNPTSGPGHENARGSRGRGIGVKMQQTINDLLFIVRWRQMWGNKTRVAKSAVGEVIPSTDRCQEKGEESSGRQTFEKDRKSGGAEFREKRVEKKGPNGE